MRPPSIRLLSIFGQSIDQHFYGVTLVERYAHSDSKRDIAGQEQSVMFSRTSHGGAKRFQAGQTDGGGGEQARLDGEKGI